MLRRRRSRLGNLQTQLSKHRRDLQARKRSARRAPTLEWLELRQLLNATPAINAGVDRVTDEGTLFGLAPATFNDPDSHQTHSAFINWGDGTPAESGTVGDTPSAGGSGTVSGSHVYADDGVYTVTVIVCDSQDACDSDALTVTVNNVAPTVNAGSDRTVNEGTTLNLGVATFNDKGTIEAHTASIDWGDGTVQSGNVSESPFGPPGSTSGANGTISFPKIGRAHV